MKKLHSTNLQTLEDMSVIIQVKYELVIVLFNYDHDLLFR